MIERILNFWHGTNKDDSSDEKPAKRPATIVEDSPLDQFPEHEENI